MTAKNAMSSTLALFLLGTASAATGTEPSCDPARGAEVFSTKCTTCHSLDPNAHGMMGPTLRGVVGRQPARIAGFAYSSALLKLSDPWTSTTLNWFLSDPIGRVPGTYMAFTGVSREADRRALICYLAEAH